MSLEQTALSIGVQAMSGLVPVVLSLEERVMWAMEYVVRNKRKLLWMLGSPSDDVLLKLALAAVIDNGDEEDEKIIFRSLKPLLFLSAALGGIPVDFGELDEDEGETIPLGKLWMESRGVEQL